MLVKFYKHYPQQQVEVTIPEKFVSLPMDKKLQVNMANLRRKLGIRPGDNRYIVNELGVGYRLQQNDE